MTALQPHLSVPEAAKALDVSQTSVRRWVRDGRIRSIKLPSGRVRLLREDIDKILTPAGRAA